MRSIMCGSYYICVCLLFSARVNADIHNSSLTTRLINMNQSQAYRLELRAAPSMAQPSYAFKPEIKLAKVHFITDSGVYTDFGNQDFNISEICAPLGYKVKSSSCTLGTYPGKACPYGNEYVDKCLTSEKWCETNGYSKRVSDCVKPEYPQEECPKNATRFKSCLRDNGRACEEDEYYLVCNREGMKPDISVAGCIYNSSYKKCVCNPCDGYSYTLKEATAQGYSAGPSCNSCGTIKYMRLEADCGAYVECDCGGIGTACWKGTKKLYASCRQCCDNRCSIADSDRKNNMLYEYEDCSGKYCALGCATNYINADNYWCNGALKCWFR